MKLRCVIFGHRWELIDVTGCWYCLRCNEIKVMETESPHSPISELDEIIHDKDWFKPKKKMK
jgi:Prophage protein (DUF1660)